MVDVGGLSDSVTISVTSPYRPFLGMYLGDIFILSIIGIIGFVLYKKFTSNNKGYYENDIGGLKNG